jgi:hypothetical protein
MKNELPITADQTQMMPPPTEPSKQPIGAGAPISKTLKRYAIVEHTHFIHAPCKLPVVLSQQEVARLLDAAPGLKYKAALSVPSPRCAESRAEIDTNG